MIKLYSTNCPRCKVLEAKLNQKNIEYTVCNDTDEMTFNNVTSIPSLNIDNNILNFTEAVKWVNSQ